MNTTWRNRSIAAVALVTLTGAGTWGTLSAVADGTTPTPNPPTATATATADQTLVKNLTYMREEERMARDLYRALLAAGIPDGDDNPFTQYLIESIVPLREPREYVNA